MRATTTDITASQCTDRHRIKSWPLFGGGEGGNSVGHGDSIAKETAVLASSALLATGRLELNGLNPQVALVSALGYSLSWFGACPDKQAPRHMLHRITVSPLSGQACK